MSKHVKEMILHDKIKIDNKDVPIGEFLLFRTKRDRILEATK